jgi:undecaprenyl-diphosphatase
VKSFVRHRRRFIAWLGGADLALLCSLLVIVVGLWSFVALAYAVSRGSVQQFDERVIWALRNPADPADPWGPPWMGEIGRDLTALGGIAALCLITAAVAGYLLICRQHRGLAFLLGATLSGLLLCGLLKNLFERPRPDIVPHLSYVSTTSFPSGHSVLSAVVYLTLGSLLARIVPQRRLKLYFLGVALFLSFLVGVSRVYMGVHYPTDVLAGWSVGLAWALVCSLVARAYARGLSDPAPAAA